MVTLLSTGLVALAHYTNFTSTSTYADGFKWIACGLSSSSEVSTATGLSSEITAGTMARSTATLTYETNTSVWSHTFTSTTNLSVWEYGIFDSSSGPGGHCLMRHLGSAAKTLVDTDTLTVTLKLVNASTT